MGSLQKKLFRKLFEFQSLSRSLAGNELARYQFAQTVEPYMVNSGPPSTEPPERAVWNKYLSTTLKIAPGVPRIECLFL